MMGIVSGAGDTYDPSPGALRPLMDTFWGPGGWHDRRTWPDPGVMREAVQAGVMFAGPRTEDHDGWVRAARTAAAPLSAEEAGEAFLASLGTRRLDLRSALGSYAVARFLPCHGAEPEHHHCRVCGQHQSAGQEPEDRNVLSFERFKWGGVRRDQVEYVAFDLGQFARAPRLRPARADIDLGRQMIDQLRNLPPETTAATAVTHLKMIKGNKAERDVLIGILGVCGILHTPGHPGYATSFIRSCDRTLPGRKYVDQHYPACWWKAANGINARALAAFLPQLS